MVDLRRCAFPTRRTLQWWEAQRAKGLLRFLLVKGALSFGILMYVSGSAIIYFGAGEFPLELRSAGGPVLVFVIFLAVGLVWAAVTWAATEWTYVSHLRKPIRF